MSERIPTAELEGRLRRVLETRGYYEILRDDAQAWLDASKAFNTWFGTAKRLRRPVAIDIEDILSMEATDEDVLAVWDRTKDDDERSTGAIAAKLRASTQRRQSLIERGESPMKP